MFRLMLAAINRRECPQQRDGGQAQFIDKPLPVAASHSLAPVTDWMLENLRADLSVEQLAARAHMSMHPDDRAVRQRTTADEWQ